MERLAAIDDELPEVRLFFLAPGGIFTANSCAPGSGGGTNEELGEGKGDPDGGGTVSERRGFDAMMID